MHGYHMYLIFLKTRYHSQVAVIEGTLLGVKFMDKNNGGRGGCIVNMASSAGMHAAHNKFSCYVV